jgi:dTDP-4-amino-4,6-dideoxygalactose transaminase
MNNRILLEQGPTFDALKKYFFAETDLTFNCGANNFSYCSSGKSAISLVLSYLRFIGILDNKMSTVLVPRWMGVEVYGSITKHSFPVFDVNSDSKALIAYHQYGFPQDMDRILDFAQSKGMVVIEDCAHAVNSKYKGKELGSIGDFGIYSFSKFVYCNALGGVSYKNDGFDKFFNECLSVSSTSLTTIINLIKLFGSYNVNRGGGKLVNLNFTSGLTSMAYSRYSDAVKPSKGSINMFEKQFKKEISSRLKNYLSIKNILSEYGVFEHLEDEDVVPYAIPLKLPLVIMHSVVEKLRIIGFETGIYNFDINRFMPEPNFIKTVLIPCHSSLTSHTVDLMLEIIVREIRSIK